MIDPEVFVGLGKEAAECLTSAVPKASESSERLAAEALDLQRGPIKAASTDLQDTDGIMHTGPRAKFGLAETEPSMLLSRPSDAAITPNTGDLWQSQRDELLSARPSSLSPIRLTGEPMTSHPIRDISIAAPIDELLSARPSSLPTISLTGEPMTTHPIRDISIAAPIDSGVYAHLAMHDFYH